MSDPLPEVKAVLHARILAHEISAACEVAFWMRDIKSHGETMKDVYHLRAALNGLDKLCEAMEVIRTDLFNRSVALTAAPTVAA